MTDTITAPQVESAPSAPTSRPVTAPLSLWVVLGAFLLAVGYMPGFTAPHWHLRTLVLLGITAVGLPLLIDEARRTLTGKLAAGFLAVATASTLLSLQPVTSLLGRYGTSSGLLFVGGLIGGWTLGLRLVERHRPLLIGAILVAAGINGLVAIYQGFAQPATPLIELYRGRAHGLVGNPVHLAALLVGAVALAVYAAKPRWWWVALVGGLSFAVQTAGARFALIVLGGVAVIAVFHRRDRFALVLVAAMALGAWSGNALFDNAGGETSIGRIGDTSSGVTERVESWKLGVEAAIERPLLGHGPGLYLDATAPRMSRELASIAPDGELFADAHNLGIEYLATTGLIGVALFGAFLLLAFRRSNGPFLAFAIAVLAFHLVQPQHVSTTSLAFLALGAAGADGLRLPVATTVRAAQVALVSVAVVCSAWFSYGDLRLLEANLDANADSAAVAERHLAPWPQPFDSSAHISMLAALTSQPPGSVESTIDGFQTAAERDPADPARWNRLADAELVFGMMDGARLHYAEALRRNPWSVRALVGAARVSFLQGDPETALSFLDRADEVSDHELIEHVRSIITG